MLNFFTKFLDSNNREIAKLQPIVAEINALEEKVKKLKDIDLIFLRKSA